MSEVKRISVFMHGPNKKIDMVEAAHFDQVTAELETMTADRDAEKEMKAKARGQRDAQTLKAADTQKRLEESHQRESRLQALLTAADERADVLETGLKWESDRNALLLASLTEAEDMLSVTSLEAGQRIDQLERALGGMLFGFDDGVGRDWSEDLLDFARRLTSAVEFKP